MLEESTALRALYGDKYPMGIVDEFQDTDDDQWHVVRALAQVSEVICLADPQQRIFDYRDNIDPKRIDLLRGELAPAEFDLGSENHRSPSTGILEFADCILHNRSPLPNTKDVREIRYFANAFAATVPACVSWTFSFLRKSGIEQPCVAVLCRSNSFVSQLSGLLLEEHTFRGHRFRPILHDVVWDADLSAVSGQVMGSVLEWPARGPIDATSRTLDLASEYFSLKNAENPSKAPATRARRFKDAAQALGKGRKPTTNAARELLEAAEQGIHFSGDPVRDWLSARRVLDRIDALAEIVIASKMIRLFQATDVLAAGLSELWLTGGQYARAAGFIRRTLDRERLVSTEREPRGYVLMTMHKSKGKEFDGVVLVEGKYRSPFMSRISERPASITTSQKSWRVRRNQAERG